MKNKIKLETTKEEEILGEGLEVSEIALEDTELTLEDIIKHPILERVAKQIESNVKTTSHTAHNSHYSSKS